MAGARALTMGQLARGGCRASAAPNACRGFGGGRTLDMLLTGGTIDGDQALRLGLVGYVAREARDPARRSRARPSSRGPLAARMAKEAVLKGYDMTLEQGIRLEEDLYALLQTTADRPKA